MDTYKSSLMSFVQRREILYINHIKVGFSHNAAVAVSYGIIDDGA